MERQVSKKWRPTLGQIVFVVLVTVLALPLVSLFLFRLYENQLIRETEAELIAQSTVISAVFARDVEQSKEPLPLGQSVRPVQKTVKSSFASKTRHNVIEDPFQPIVASLDLTSSGMLGTRPPASRPQIQVNPGYLEVGRGLQPILSRTQRVTLAGFRLTDPNGIVIAGRDEIGLSLAHVEEVRTALQGQYRAVLRTRVVDEPPPLYSLSRGTRVRIFVAMPVIVNDQVAGVVYTSRTPNNIIRHIYEERGKFILAGLAIMALAILIGQIFLRGIARPIRGLVARSEEIGRGEREDATMPHYGTKEIAVLAQSLTNMAQQLNQRAHYISTFAAHVSHELKSPLTSIQGAAELLRDDTESSESLMSNDDRRRFLDNIIADTSRSTLILNRLRELARADNPQAFGETEIISVINQLCKSFPTLKVHGEGAIHSRVPMTEENAEIVFFHLADNAARHGATELHITVRSEPKYNVIYIQDNGSGISEGNRDKIFEAFFTTRRNKGGTGMGLGIVQAMLRAHRGYISLYPSETGAVFEIKLPKME